MKRVLAVSAAATAAAVAVGLAGHAGPRPASASQNILNGPSPAVGVHAYLTRPERAPSELRADFAAARAALARGGGHGGGDGPRGRGGVFNDDTVGLPQNEESVNSCRGNRAVVLEGTNDYRYILDPQGNSTGWHFSADGGRSLTNEGLLPALTGPDGSTLPSGGDPVDVAADGCDSLYAGDLNYDATQDFPFPSGVGLYRSTPRTLATCPQGQSDGGMTHPECWPTHRLVDFAAPGHFLDKEWMDVGRSGSAGRVVWMAYGDLSAFDAEGNEQSGVIKAVRCSADLSSCTPPIVLSSGQTVAEYPWVTIGPDGRTYITWGQFFGGSFTGPSQQAWVAVAEPGSTTFKRYPVYREDQVMRGHEVLHSADFRTGTMFKNTVAMVHGHPRIYVTWERCRVHAQDQVCEEPEIPLTYSDDLGQTWSPQRVVSAGGDNYFPFIDADPDTGDLVEVYYTHRFDPVFHNRQDVELDHLAPNGAVTARERITPFSNETEADPILGGTFIGDYIEVDAKNGRDYTGYNANYRSVQFIHDGFPIPQQDNYLDVR